MFYFCKMQATGNDFVIINYINNEFEYSFKRLAEFLCDRHYGVGSDGILIVDKSEIADFKMRIFNCDGNEAEMCGNGIRCFSKYVFEHKLTDKKCFKIETLAGIKEVLLNVEGETVISVKVNMGNPIFDYNIIPIIYNENVEEERKIDKILDKNKEEIQDNKIKEEIKDTKVKEDNIECIKNDVFNKEEIKKYMISRKIQIDNKEFYGISMGNPHVVCFQDNIEEIDIDTIGKKVENYKYFPNKTNVEFVQIIDKNRIKVRIWERGVGETLSCGTGVCAASVISNLLKDTNREISVKVKGGNLKIDYDLDKNIVFLEGEAQEVFKGKLKI